MKVVRRELFSDNIYSHQQESVLLSLKANWMQRAVPKSCRVGPWFHSRPGQRQPRNQCSAILTGYRAMKRSSCSSTTTYLAVRRRRKRQASYHLARSRSLTYKTTIKMRQTPSLPMTLTRFVALFGMRGLTVQMGSLKLNLF